MVYFLLCILLYFFQLLFNCGIIKVLWDECFGYAGISSIFCFECFIFFEIPLPNVRVIFFQFKILINICVSFTFCPHSRLGRMFI